MDFSVLKVGMTREQVVEILGKPDVMGGTSRKYKRPSIYKYGNTEVWFDRNGYFIRIYVEE